MSTHSSEIAPTPVQAQLAAARRSQILDGATRVFAARGFHRATIKAIARAAGVAEGTIYNYFASKEDLLFGLLDRLNETAERPAAFAALANSAGPGASGPAPSGADLDAVFAGLVGHRLELAGAHLPLLKALIPELLFNDLLRERYAAEILAPTTALGKGAFDALAAAGALRPMKSELVVRLVAAMIFGVLMLELLGDPVPAERRDELPSEAVALLLDGLRARGEAP